MAFNYKDSKRHILNSTHSERLIWTRDAESWPPITGLRDDTLMITHTQNDYYGHMMLGHGL
jgi:hypothetical protein